LRRGGIDIRGGGDGAAPIDTRSQLKSIAKRNWPREPGRPSSAEWG
jgi:hypothetical protein